MKMITCALAPKQAAVVSQLNDEMSCCYAVALAVDMWSKTMFISLADRRVAVVPLSVFQPSGTTAPDFKRPSLKDYGQTIRFGKYEADVLLALDHCLRPSLEGAVDTSTLFGGDKRD